MLLGGLLLLAACGSRAPTSTPGPIRYHSPVPPAAYAHYIRGRYATYQRDYATAVREFEAARREAPDEPELAAALFEALLLHLSSR